MSWRNVIGTAVGLCLLAIAGCGKNSSDVPMGTMKVGMTDAPADFQAVNIVVTEVAAHGAGIGDSTSGWEVLNRDATTYDLLALRNGVFATIGLARIPAGHYTQLRLKIGAGSNVVVNGVSHALNVPSGSQTGFKLVGSFDVPANGLLDLALDFDAARSVVQNGDGYLLQPTVRVMPFSTAGAIAGTISPAGTAATIYAIQPPDTVGSALAANDGSFQVSVLPAGVYSLAIHPQAGFRDTTLAGVTVDRGVTKQVGAIVLTPQ
jgi:uncharacterized protein DUF4382